MVGWTGSISGQAGVGRSTGCTPAGSRVVTFHRHRPARCHPRTCTAAAALGHQLLDEWGRSHLAQDDELPLLHKRVLVTAPRQYAQKLCSKLTSAGARALWLPGVKISQLTDPEDLEQLDASLAPILSGASSGPGLCPTHIAFTSKNGIYAVVQRLAELAGGVAEATHALSSCGAQLCALGADGEVLKQLGLPLHVSPPEPSTLGLVRHLVQSGAAPGARVLCPVPLVTGGLSEPPVVPRFLQALLQAGCTPLRVNAYVTSMASSPEQCTAEAELLLSGHIHAIAFSSTAEAQGLLQLVGGKEVLKAALLQHGVVAAAHGPYTAAGASEVLGLPVDCVSQDFKTFDGLVRALEQRFKQRCQ